MVQYGDKDGDLDSNFEFVSISPFYIDLVCLSLYLPKTRLGMFVTTQGGSGRQCVTGPRRNISKCRFVLLNVYRIRET